MGEKAHIAASREIKKFLLSTVRNDWEWPAPSGPADAPSGVSTPAHGRTPVAYRERYYGTTDDEDEEYYEQQDERSDDDVEEEFKFDNPDAVAGVVQSMFAKRKRRRRKALEEEMRWNSGLKCFIERRNAWTAARSKGDNVRQHATTSALEKRVDEDHGHADEELPETDPVLPILPPLIDSSNSLRAAITPKAYSDIYAKIVTSTRTPTTPINLVDMTRSLVQGWKENGEWPPKASAVEPRIAGRKSKRAQNGRDLALEAAMGLHEGMMQEGQANGHGVSVGEGLLAHHPHFKKGVESVKKVLRLSGSHSNASAHASPHHAGLEGPVQ